MREELPLRSVGPLPVLINIHEGGWNHGDSDPIVPYQQSVFLFEKLKENAIKVEFLTIPGGQHGSFSKEENALFIDKMWYFLEQLDLTNQNL